MSRKIRIDFSDLGQDVDEIDKDQAYRLLLGAITDDSIDIQRLSKFVYILEI